MTRVYNTRFYCSKSTLIDSISMRLSKRKLTLGRNPENARQEDTNSNATQKTPMQKPRNHSNAIQDPTQKPRKTQEETVIFGFGFLLRLRSWFGFGILRNGFRWRRKNWLGFLGAWKKGRRWWTGPEIEKKKKKKEQRKKMMNSGSA